MQQEPFFEWSSYHFALALLGSIIILARWLPRLVSRREPAAAPMMILLGAAASLAFPGLPTLPDPRENPVAWELVS